MPIDALSLPDATTLDAEVCVIGAGPAGITVARELAAAGRDVLLLDSGGERPDARSRDLAGGERVGRPYPRLEDTRERAFGGTSHGWPWIEGWRARPLDPVDLEAGRGRDVGWPITYDELARHYPEAERRCGLQPAIEDPSALAGPATPLLPLNDDRARTVAFRYSLTTFTDPVTALGGAAVRVLLRATVVALERTGGAESPVGAAAVRGPDGRSLTVRAGLFVLATGGIENATLLLSSRGTDAAGIGNRYDLVGRCFMERLTFRAGMIVPTRPELTDRLGFYDIHRVGDLGVQGVVTPSEDLLRRHGLRNVVFFLDSRAAHAASEGVRSLGALLHLRDRRPLPPAIGRHLAAVARGAPDVVRTAVGRAARRSGGSDGVVLLRAQAEPTPLHRSRVTLSRQRDALGRRRAQLDWRIDAADLASVGQAAELVGAAFEAAGLGRLQRSPAGAPAPLMDAAHHHLGTTRMHPHPARGVVDADCRVHGVPNLYVAGSSVFPTVGYANPTLTIVALALRLAAHLRRA
jgi:choline dehydrogenase-like flavoprotein